ncbi:MAG: hypothetical protein KBT00_03345 [Bacteroidales bacterium]|nr:hypothetical protein [Candidatus Cacconaster merdequi]
MRKLILALSFVLLSSALSARNAEKDSLFRLVSAERAQQLTEFGSQYRRVTGSADFLHNDTHLYCDSASWNVNYRRIEAFGNVRLVQDNTMLTSESLIYDIDLNTAHFRGGVVQLTDKDGNILRTYELDYNTKDSIGFFRNGGAMMDRDSNVIESKDGIYDSKAKTFTFENNVEMYMDSIRISTSQLEYRTDNGVAYFKPGTKMWRDDGFLKAEAGWYDKEGKKACFMDKVYAENPSYELWSDELHYSQENGEIWMYHNSQILDTTDKSYYIADYIHYEPDSLDGRVVMTDNPAVVYCGENEDNEPDTLWVGADTLLTYSVRRCDIPEEEVKEAGKRLEDILFDTLEKKRAELAAEYEKKQNDKLREAGMLPPESAPGTKETDDSGGGRDDGSSSDAPPPVDSVSIPAPLDSIPPEPDTSATRYLFAWHNVKAYRSDIQGVCDSLCYCAIDSVARLHGRPALWNEVKNQITAQQMNILIKDGNLSRGSLITDSWVVSQADSTHFNQIKSAEMMSYFRDNKLYRFDALGGVNTIFYLEEEGRLTTANVKEAKMMSSMIKDGNARRILYVEAVNSDAFPLFELEAEKHFLKGFEWRASERPASRTAVCDKDLHQSERDKYVGLIPPLFYQTNRFFDNCMKKIFPETEGMAEEDDCGTQMESVVEEEVESPLQEPQQEITPELSAEERIEQMRFSREKRPDRKLVKDAGKIPQSAVNRPSAKPENE